MLGRFTIVALSLAGALAAGCTLDRTNPMEPGKSAPNVRQFVTGPAMSEVDADGRFVLPPPRAPDGVPIITPGRARDLAVAFLRTWGVSHYPVWERQRGEPFDLGALQPSGRVFYAETPLARFPDGHHPAYRRMYGPWYLVYFATGAEAVLGVAVSAYATDLEIHDGRIHQPRTGGEYFITHAVTAPGRSAHPFIPAGPESAVVHVGSRTGAKAAGVPHLILRAGWHPLQAVWLVPLDRQVRVRRTSRGYGDAADEQSNALYLGSGGDAFLPRATQPSHVRVAVGSDNADPTQPAAIIELGRRGDLPLVFDEVSLQQQEGS